MAKMNDLGETLNQTHEVHLDGSIEYWRDLPGYEGFYRVSSFGRILSMARTVSHNKGRGKRNFKKDKLMKATLSVSRLGYRRYTLNLRGKGRREGITPASAVLTAFVGPRPENMDACHAPDPDTSNNRLENLRWDTRKGNSADQEMHGTKLYGQSQNSTKLTDQKVSEIRQKYAAGGRSMQSLCDEYGITLGTIHPLIRRRTWTHIS